jgi:hypothetical protein
MATLEQIKVSKVYLNNLPAIRKLYPGMEDEFAKQLQIASVDQLSFSLNSFSIVGAFRWKDSPQGLKPWQTLYEKLEGFGSNI